MKIFLLIVSLLCSVYVNCSVLKLQPKLLKVSLYYEVLCPFCNAFIIEELYPGYQKIGQFLELEFIPYGNADRTEVDGKWQFNCQHGRRECDLNKMAACGLFINSTTTNNMDYVNCIQKYVKEDEDVIASKCAPILGLSGEIILKCSKGEEGDKLLLLHGEKTDALEPPLQGVPTIVFNDVNDEKLDDDARDNFLKTACKLLLNKPEACVGLTEVLKVSIYYESLCPDSMRFITRQLYPAYQAIGSSLLIDFVPYGKATQQKVNGKWEFQCQHGKKECWGNKAQACGIAQGKGQDKDVEFINCVMRQQYPANQETIDKCAEKLDITSEPILECSESNQGDELLAKYGEQTLAVDPVITFVPTITFNDKYDSKVQSGALKDFLKTACSALIHKHDNCPKDSVDYLSKLN